MKRYLLHMRYLGTRFSGMQKQPDCSTVQGTVEDALTRYVKPNSLSPLDLHISSRTDAGVHALSTTAHLDLCHPTGGIYDVEKILSRMNNDFANANHDVRISSFTEVSQDFHARHSADSRTYLYRFMVPKSIKKLNFPVAELNRCYMIKSPSFDAERVRQGMNLFLGKKDFRTFSARKRNRYTNSAPVYVRKINHLALEKGNALMIEDPLSENFVYWNVKCTAKSFLYNQVRRMVGALVGLGLGHISEKDIRCMLEVPSRHSWNSRAVPAPSHGLYLVNVNYNSLDLIKIDAGL